MLVDSLHKVGASRSIVVDENGVILAGNGVVEAASEAGMTKLQIVDADGDTIVAVRRRGLSEEQKRHLAIADNRTAELATWNVEQLKEDAANGLDLSPFFFDEELKELLVDGTVKPGLTDPDAIPDERATGIQRGDLFELGSHRLLCGDCTVAEDVARLMRDDRAGVMNIDPPYGVTYANDERPNPGVAKPRVGKPRVANDDLSGDTFAHLLTDACLIAKDTALADAAAWYIWFANVQQHWVLAAAAAAAVKLHREIIWVKPVLLLGRGQYHWKHEPCFMGWVEGHQPPDYGLGHGERTQTTVWEIDSVTQAERKTFNHSTPKPVGLFTTPIVKHLLPGEIAFDSFAGTGPQIIAAEQLGRRCFAMDIEPSCCQVAIDRFELFTGQKAVKVGEAVRA